MTKNLKIIFIWLSLLGCGQNQSSELRAIIGENDFEDYPELDAISTAIGRTVVGCTVAHLGEGLVMTAGHCVPSNYCRSNSHVVTWGFIASRPQGVLRSRCEDVISRNFGPDSDFALLKYDRYPEPYIPVNLDQKPSEGEPLTIFSHPDGEPLQGSGWCWHLGDYLGKKFKYDCDTLKGSSGAPILNEQFEIVGIHNLGKASLGFNAGTYLQDIVEDDE
ncbi:MAG: trypsin-like peptidase domain-containing protein [Pseudobacteriovorax sp.]|nr:trypsin-like peptidase domain-containing protein [Pseudobacteriovorax sp.]